ncbi:MAG TPA: sulfatase-like hydrolase/transferase [Stellaceae bacterium]
MQRRDFLKQAATAGGALAAAGLLPHESEAVAAEAGLVAGPQPNILFIIVDEFRYPTVFPKGIHDAGGFLRKYMPHTYRRLWQRGVKFAGHFTAGTACSPARGGIVTGLYPQQSWLLTTILDAPDQTISYQPVLSRQYPTYGKLLRQAGYQTPYIGKWHLSIPQQPAPLDAYGFAGMTLPDPTGSNLQGTVGVEPLYLSDTDIAGQAATWLGQQQAGAGPWCLTVGFINPHDKEFFPAGTEFQTFTNLFQSSTYNPNGYAQWIDFTKGPPAYDWATNPLKAPPPQAYPAVPPNWESADQISRRKPSTQSFARLFQEAVWGGVNDDPQAAGFQIIKYRGTATDNGVPYGVAQAPYSYWQRSLDSYTQIMTVLDGNLKTVFDAVDALPAAVRDNTILVFTSDHGEYAGAHGFVSGKAGSCYDEVFNVPLIVADPSGRFTGDTASVRRNLTSSVDLLPLLVSLGYRGSREWLRQGDPALLYRGRHNLLPMLKSADAAGRLYVVFTSDEAVPNAFNFNGSPGHLIGLRTVNAKLGVYANWVPGGNSLAFDGTMEFEYYDYATPGGRAETDNRGRRDPGAALLYALLLHRVLPDELRAPLPPSLVPAQTVAANLYLDYVNLINSGSLGATDFPFRIGDI